MMTSRSSLRNIDIEGTIDKMYLVQTQAEEVKKQLIRVLPFS